MNIKLKAERKLDWMSFIKRWASLKVLFLYEDISNHQLLLKVLSF